MRMSSCQKSMLANVILVAANQFLVAILGRVSSPNSIFIGTFGNAVLPGISLSGRLSPSAVTMAVKRR